MEQIEPPDFVIPMSQIGTYLDPMNQVCGLTFQDTANRKYLLPMPGTVLAQLAADTHKAVASIPGLLEWESKMPGKK